MTSVPDRSRVRLAGISSRAYEHPADRSALVALRKLSGFDTLLKKMMSLFPERAFRLVFLASAVKVSERQFPHIYEMVRDGCYILDIDTVPDVYVTQAPIPNAMAVGFDKPFIVINSSLVDLCDPEELRAVVGHELGHILSGHSVYRTMLLILLVLASRIAWLPIGYLGLRAIIWGLEEWFRKSELSCDRAGLLAGQDIDASRRVLMKLAGGSRLAEMNADAFHEQAHEYDATPDLRDGILKILQLQGNTHPFAVVRFAEIDNWYASGEYQRILAGDYPRRADDRTASLGEEIRNAANAYRESWARSEDGLTGLLRGAVDTVARAGGGLFGRGGSGSGSGSSGSGGSGSGSGGGSDTRSDEPHDE
ncbi:MAG TPA: M48 family metallopeptidase [Streptosporangiaceae bacterium]|nr:M48 family metallopeptidase [Streptosporangiaceae bacterium]